MAKLPVPDSLLRAFARFEERFTRDILFHMQLEATRDSARYAADRMRMAQHFVTRNEVLRHALRHSAQDGLYLEFGVASGVSINEIARAVPATVHGFDSFAGLPEAWTLVDQKAAYSHSSEVPEVESNVELHVGLFADSLPGFLSAHAGHVAFLHVDCDLYSSTKDVFDHVGDRIGPGTVIVFDEYFNYVGWRDHEFKAFQEFVDRVGLSYRYLGFNRKNRQVSVIVEEIGSER